MSINIFVNTDEGLLVCQHPDCGFAVMPEGILKHARRHKYTAKAKALELALEELTLKTRDQILQQFGTAISAAIQPVAGVAIHDGYTCSLCTAQGYHCRSLETMLNHLRTGHSTKDAADRQFVTSKVQTLLGGCNVKYHRVECTELPTEDATEFEQCLLEDFNKKMAANLVLDEAARRRLVDPFISQLEWDTWVSAVPLDAKTLKSLCAITEDEDIIPGHLKQVSQRFFEELQENLGKAPFLLLRHLLSHGYVVTEYHMLSF